MAFELGIHFNMSTPNDLRERWPEMLVRHGVECSVHPEFSPHAWADGFLPFKVTAMPSELIGEDLIPPAVSGFEVGFSENYAHFRSAMGRTATEFALLCLCAAEFAISTYGEYGDPQSSELHSGSAARQAALTQIAATLKFPGAASRTQHPFEGWE